MKEISVLTLSILLSMNIYSQISIGGSPPSMNTTILKTSYQIPTINLPKIDESVLLQEDKERNDSLYRIGKLIPVNVNIISNAKKSVLDSQYVTYQLKIVSKGAKSIQLSFEKFKLPEDSRLYVYSPDYNYIAGAFTKQNNRDDEKFSIQPILGEEIIIEVVLSEESINQVKLKLDYVCHNYKEIEKLALKSSSSTDCFLDVHCNNFISNQIRSVMRWSYYDKKKEGNYVCSCVLMNQDVPRNNLKYYVLTAEHCGDHADLSNATFYFNYQKRDCDVGSGTFRYSTVGASKKAERSIYDMYLMELAETPPEYYNVHFAGWDRSSYNDLWPWVFGIHHPHGWVKKSSEGSLAANTNLYKWRVRWDEYPTEGGSSGSPLFEDWHGRVIGQLSNGLASCNHPGWIDRYGKLRKAWDASSSDKRLRSWLDPNGNDKTGIDGVDPCYTNVTIENSEAFYLNLRSAQNDYQPNNNVIIQAGNELSTSGLINIENNAEYTFRAGNKIQLNPGFRVEAGGTFYAEIAPCSELKYSRSRTKSATLISNSSINEIKNLNNTTSEIIESESSIIKFYPNPVNSVITIDMILSEKENIVIRIINSQGKTVKVLDNKTFEAGLYTDNYCLFDLPNGLYILSFSSNNMFKNLKLIKR